MGQFVESAILKVTDKSSGKINKINRDLGKLLKTAKSVSASLAGINGKGLTRAATQANRLTESLRRTSSVANKLSRPIDVRIKSNAQKSIADLNRIVSARNKLKGAAIVNVDTSRAIASLNRLQVKHKAVTAIVRAPTTVNLNASKANSVLDRLLAKKKRLAAPFTIRGTANITQTSVPNAGRRRGTDRNQTGDTILDGSRRTVKGRIKRGAGQAISGEVSAGLRQVGRSGLGALRRRSKADEAFRRITNNDTEKIRKIDVLATQLSAKFQLVSKTQIKELATELLAVVPDLAQLEPILTALVRAQQGSDPAKADAFGTAALKIIDALNSADKGDRAQALIKALAKLQVVLGSDADLAKILDQTRKKASFASGLAEKAFIRLTALSEESGARNTLQSAKLVSDAVTSSSISDEKKQKQIKQGLRNKDGTSKFAELARSQPLKFINTELKDRVIAAGIDPKNQTAVQKFFTEILGLGQAASERAAFFLSKEAAIRRIDKQLKELNLSRTDTAPSNSVDQGLTAIGKQSDNVINAAFSPFEQAMAKVLGAMSGMLSRLATGGVTGSKTLDSGIALSTASVSALALAISNEPGRTALTAGVALNTSAVAANTAAINRNTASNAGDGLLGKKGKGLIGSLLSFGKGAVVFSAGAFVLERVYNDFFDPATIAANKAAREQRKQNLITNNKELGFKSIKPLDNFDDQGNFNGPVKVDQVLIKADNSKARNKDYLDKLIPPTKPLKGQRQRDANFFGFGGRDAKPGFDPKFDPTIPTFENTFKAGAVKIEQAVDALGPRVAEALLPAGDNIVQAIINGSSQAGSNMAAAFITGIAGTKVGVDRNNTGPINVIE